MDKNKIKDALDTIRKAIEVRVEVADPTGVANKLEQLASLTGLSAETVAQSRKLLDFDMAIALKSYKSETATDKKIFLQRDCGDLIFLVNYSESLNKDLHYTIEATRTLISLAKTEMQSIR